MLLRVMLPGGCCNVQQSVKALKMHAMSKTETGANQYSPTRSMTNPDFTLPAVHQKRQAK